MLKHIIKRWNGFSAGQKRTVWLASFLSPLLPVLLFSISKLFFPEGEVFIGYKEVLIISYASSLGPISTVALLARPKKV